MDFAIPGDHQESEKTNKYLNFVRELIGLYTPIIKFGRYATCSHNKDGRRTHIQFRETIGQENHVTCVKLRPHKFRPAFFGADSKTCIFYKYVVFKHSSSFLPNSLTAATHSLQCDSISPTDVKKQQHGWASRAFIPSKYFN